MDQTAWHVDSLVTVTFFTDLSYTYSMKIMM